MLHLLMMIDATKAVLTKCYKLLPGKHIAGLQFCKYTPMHMPMLMAMQMALTIGKCTW
jgi:hypothetical protein